MKTNRWMLHFLITIILSIPLIANSGPIPDTGPTQSYTDTIGEDSDYAINPPYYTKLYADGNELPEGVISWAMVRFNMIGLILEVTIDDESTRDKDNVHNWQDAPDIFIENLDSHNFGKISER
ncbi:hypothetical protein ACFL9U_09595 [Thermodesulfobacteriota bacterium]